MSGASVTANSTKMDIDEQQQEMDRASFMEKLKKFHESKGVFFIEALYIYMYIYTCTY